jgi:hypothetical protein
MPSHVLETRSIKPPTSEAHLVIEHREALIYMICEAAELEHGLMCEYLFAAFSLKDRVSQGPSEEQLAAIRRWRSTLLGVAAEEMLHLALTANMLTALGASPHLSRPNLPQPARHYPAALAAHLSEGLPELAPIAAALARLADQIGTGAAPSEE